MLLILRLAFAREKPVDEHFRRVRMRQLAQDAQRPLRSAHVDAFFKRARFEAAERQSLFYPRLYFAGGGRERDGELSDGKPVDELARLPGDNDVHFAEKLPQKSKIGRA